MGTFTAAPIIRKPMALMHGLLGYTDHVNIYIASELNSDEYRTVMRHEQAHVWLRHIHRRPVPSGDFDHDMWVTAKELEIAVNIYDEEDLQNIRAPRSRLNTTIHPDLYPELPKEIRLAEDIYAWLMENKKPEPKKILIVCDCGEHGPHMGPSDGPRIEINLELLPKVRAELDERENKARVQQASTAHYKSIIRRPPSLISEIDAALRVRVNREVTYRRPSRRHIDSNIIMPGAMSVPRPPLVEIFVDRSGSFTPEKTAKAESLLKTVLARYGSSIKHDVWFFSDDRLVSTDPRGGGNTPYHLIGEHLVRSRPKMAIILTDNDSVYRDIPKIHKNTIGLCVPIGCSETKVAQALGARDVIW